MTTRTRMHTPRRPHQCWGAFKSKFFLVKLEIILKSTHSQINTRHLRGTRFSESEIGSTHPDFWEAFFVPWRGGARKTPESEKVITAALVRSGPAECAWLRGEFKRGVEAMLEVQREVLSLRPACQLPTTRVGRRIESPTGGHRRPPIFF